MRTGIVAGAACILFVSLNAHASTTVTVDNNEKVTVTQQPVVYVPVVPQPVVIVQETDPRNVEGVIFRVDMSEGQIMVQDTAGRERRIQLKQGMIGTYKVDDYVRIYLMADMKEAKTIETVRGVRHLDGNIVGINALSSQIIVRGADGKDSTVIVRQGQIDQHRMGDRIRIYLIENNEEVQVIRVIR